MISRAARASIVPYYCEIKTIIAAAAMVASFKIVMAGLVFGKLIAPSALIMPTMIVVLAALAARFKNQRLAFAYSVLAVYKLMALGAFFWYIEAFHLGRMYPLMDTKLASLDSLLGFDYVSYIKFMDNHYWLNAILHPAYMSILWQPILITFLLIYFNQGLEALRFMFAFGLGIVVVTFLAIFFAAYGAYHFFGITPILHPHIVFLETGDGTTAALDWLRTVSPIGEMPETHGGLIAFPSFHTTAAALFIYYSRNNRLLLYASALLNTFLLIATPLHGSHYLSDMIAGVFVALTVIAIVHLLVQRSSPGLPTRRSFAAPTFEGASA